MKNIFIITALLLLAAPVQAEETVQPIQIARTNSDQRALTEILSARINASLQGERYTLGAADRDEKRDVSISR
jgi:hypothetical protein